MSLLTLLTLTKPTSGQPSKPKEPGSEGRVCQRCPHAVASAAVSASGPGQQVWGRRGHTGTRKWIGYPPKFFWGYTMTALHVRGVARSRVAGNAGAAALVAGGWSLAKIAEAADVSRQSAKRWRDASKLPGASAQVLLREAFGIEPALWRQAAGKAPSAPRRSRKRAAKPAATPADRMRAQLVEIDAMRAAGPLAPGAQLELLRAERQAAATLARIEAGKDLSEQRILASAAWRRLWERIAVVLKKYPDVARELGEALKEAA